ncbi:MAG TPA: hypothetical protein VGD59_06150 [Acidisarcina sp.]
MLHAIPLWILVLSLFLPRITMALAWFDHQLPSAHMPDLAGLLLWALLPRVLMLIYIYFNLGLGIWFLAHLIALILVWGGSGRQASNRWS